MMHDFPKKPWFFPLFLTLTLGVFFGFGLIHLTQFETTDEHFWKYERIPEYMSAWREGKWKKTYINDKPGISVALVSGTGLLFVDPTTHRIRDPEETRNGTFTLYDSSRTESINRALRLPILLTNTFLLLLLFFAARAAFGSPAIALPITIATALSPILLGISQIINPDALLWSTGGVAFMSFLAFLRTHRLQWILLSTLFTTFALLSKYTAIVLIPLFLITWISTFLFEKPSSSDLSLLKKETFGFIGLLIGSLFFYALFLPAVFVKPELLYSGTYAFLSRAHLLVPLSLILFILIGDTFINRGRLMFSARNRIVPFLPFTRFLLLIPILLFSSIILFGIGNQTILPLSTLIETAKENDVLAFPLLSSYPDSLALVVKFMAELFPVFFSIPPLMLGFLFVLLVRVLLTKHHPLLLITLLVSFFSIAYAGAALFSGVLTNARYNIILFPLFAILIGLGLRETVLLAEQFFKRPLFFLAPPVILLIGIFTFLSAQPFFFNYINPLLAKSFALHDGWGYGYAEAAEVLNALPNANTLTVWSDRNGICQFLDGPKCLSGYRIDTTQNPPDYIVISKRGRERNYIARDKKTNEPLFLYDTTNRLREKSIWNLSIGDRPENFVMILKAH